ncbi:lysophospholipid acyltransferase family protein [Rickettsia endosymbiont of Cardiosporidium cionae]|uniref:lysophospholipid acyltransferase family protein n=1 Tax=Rickettsia endosymbiont of Cardiosporidium cionae TaxID=2777155 RepID=UPI0018949171|nr:lysophospholipid acyltransferase family protein [Rickettsia endosymbiont of Cardiosporidium cionae]KAF8818989.1 1-acyl-sn-glycerol-3-phosphate acyltransferase [Rickettsia endosymbiont of Cardiosporidium cionae]
MLWHLRIILFYLLISCFSIIFLGLFGILINIFNATYDLRYRMAEIFSVVFIKLLTIICNIHYKVENIKELPDNFPYLVLANHQSFWENIFVQLIIPKHSWVIKKELYNIPVFGWGLKTLSPIAVDRNYNGSITQILTEGQKKFKQGLNLVIFPESTRIPVGKNVKFKAAPAKLAIMSNVPIVLIVHNAGLIWPKGFWFKKPGLITVKIIETISIEKLQEFDVRSLTQYIENRINTEKNNLISKD